MDHKILIEAVWGWFRFWTGTGTKLGSGKLEFNYILIYSDA